MSDRIVEAALYGDLVKYLCDRWAAQAAEFNESSVGEERKQIDELIRAWFFTPQTEDLHGLTPRDVIRNEQMNRPNVIPRDKLRDALDEDYDFMIEDGLLTEDNMDEWHFGLVPDMCLLDEYDPEGYNERWASDSMDMEEDPDERTSNMPPQDAREWLAQNGNPRSFAGNRFYDNKEALGFVDRLYELGAVKVWVDNILDEPYRLREQGGPYADTFIVELPDDSTARARLYGVWDHELRERQREELNRYFEDDVFIFWWD